MRRPRGALACAALLAGLAGAGALRAQTEAERSLELEGGRVIAYRLHAHPADAHVARPAAALGPESALDTARLLNLHLSVGDIEEASLLSNSPRRRFEVLQDYRRAVGDEEFKRVFAQYLAPENRLIAEIAIGPHRLLIWELKQVAAAPGQSHLAGQYFVEIEGRYFIDDVPSATRASLRRVLEAYRAGKIAR
jgi:hypothetical protein